MRRISAPTLIELSIETLKNEIRPSLGPEHRYAMAMVIRALQTARNEIISEPEADQWQLLDHIYDEGEGQMVDLARDIRTGKISDSTHPDLRKRLEVFLLGEVGARNPAVIKQRAAS